HLRHADVDGAEHHQHDHGNDVEPLLAGDLRAGVEQSRLQEIEDIAHRHDYEGPPGAALAAQPGPPGVKLHHSLPPRCLATLSRSLSPRPDRFTTIRWSV